MSQQCSKVECVVKSKDSEAQWIRISVLLAIGCVILAMLHNLSVPSFHLLQNEEISVICCRVQLLAKYLHKREDPWELGFMMTEMMTEMFQGKAVLY